MLPPMLPSLGDFPVSLLHAVAAAGGVVLGIDWFPLVSLLVSTKRNDARSPLRLRLRRPVGAAPRSTKRIWPGWGTRLGTEARGGVCFSTF